MRKKWLRFDAADDDKKELPEQDKRMKKIKGKYVENEFNLFRHIDSIVMHRVRCD